MTEQKYIDPEELLFTLDQLQQTTEVMARVITRLKHQLLQLQDAQNQQRESAAPAAPPLKQSGRRLH